MCGLPFAWITLSTVSKKLILVLKLLPDTISKWPMNKYVEIMTRFKNTYQVKRWGFPKLGSSGRSWRTVPGNESEAPQLISSISCCVLQIPANIIRALLYTWIVQTKICTVWTKIKKKKAFLKRHHSTALLHKWWGPTVPGGRFRKCENRKTVIPGLI